MCGHFPREDSGRTGRHLSAGPESVRTVRKDFLPAVPGRMKPDGKVSGSCERTLYPTGWAKNSKFFLPGGFSG